MRRFSVNPLLFAALVLFPARAWADRTAIDAEIAESPRASSALPVLDPLGTAQMIAKGFGIPEHSKIVLRFARALQKGQAVHSRRSVAPERTNTRPPIVRHIRFEKARPFPKDLSKPRQPVGFTPAPQFEPANFWPAPHHRQRMERMQQGELRRALTPEVLPSCERDIQSAIENGARVPPGVDPDQEVLFDALFLRFDAPRERDGLIPFDELFGPEAVVHYYRAEFGDPISTLVSSYGIECLPFRIRVTRSEIQRLYGIPALSRFAPKGRKKHVRKAALHPSVERRLKEFR